MLRRAPMADPVVFRVAGYDIALRPGPGPLHRSSTAAREPRQPRPARGPALRPAPRTSASRWSAARTRGKTTLFNALTGLRAKTGNYPGRDRLPLRGPAPRSATATSPSRTCPAPTAWTRSAPTSRSSPTSSTPSTARPPTPGRAARHPRRDHPAPLAAACSPRCSQTGLPVVRRAHLHRRARPPPGVPRRRGALGRALGVPVVAVVAGGRRQAARALRDAARRARRSWSRPARAAAHRPAEVSSLDHLGARQPPTTASRTSTSAPAASTPSCCTRSGAR